MRMLKSQFVSLGIATLFGLALSGCQSPQHRMAEPQSGTKIACRMCYDQIKEVSHPRYGKLTRKVHACSGCQSELSMYSENGVPMAKCARCAPEGVACDKCLPPDSSAK